MEALCAGYRPELIDLIWNREIDPGKVFDVELPLEGGAVLRDTAAAA